MSKLTLKVQEMISKDEEIRTFYVDADVAKNFASLRERLETVFPILRTKKYLLEWRGDYFFCLSFLMARDFLMFHLHIY